LSIDLNYPLTRYVLRPVSVPVARAIARTPFTPAQVSWASAVFTGAAGVAFGFSEYVLGALLTLAGSITDCVDGDLARLTGRTSRAGALLDSVLDRWTDAALIIGLAFSDLDSYAPVAFFALAGAFLVSYTRARAQSLGTDCPEGIATREVRMVLLVVAALFGQPLAGLWLVAGLSGITAVHRLVASTRALATVEGIERAGPGPSHPSRSPGPDDG
jgi:archaetidylinositol phosphate synthase